MGTCCATVKSSVTPIKFSSSLSHLKNSSPIEDLNMLDSSWQVIRGLSTTEKESSRQDKTFFTSTKISQSFFEDLGISISSKKGLKSSPFNQDDFSIILSKEALLISVFDGHGIHGSEISNYLHIVLPNMILTHPSFPSEIESVLRESFFKCNIYLHQYCETIKKTTDLSGSTCTILILHTNTLYICNIGDSKAILIDSQNQVHKLTVDHKPSDPLEKERIIKSGGEIKQLNNETSHRIFVKNMRIPGISVSRAFGDSIAQTIGVTVDPEISKRTVGENDLFLVVSSDGVWEFLTDINVMDIIINSTEQPASALVNMAWDKWIEIEVDAVDDITAVVLDLRKFRSKV